MRLKSSIWNSLESDEKPSLLDVEEVNYSYSHNIFTKN